MSRSTERVGAEILSVHDGVRARVVRHKGTAIMCRNAGERVVSYEEIATAMVTVTANFNPLIEAFKSIRESFGTLNQAFRDRWLMTGDES